jgi:hypothetical protein
LSLVGLDAFAVERTTNHSVAYSRKILYSSTSNKHLRVLIQVVIDSWDVSSNFLSVTKSHSANLSLSGIGLLGLDAVHSNAYSSLLRILFQVTCT